MAKSIRKIITHTQQAGADFRIQGHNEACFYALGNISDEDLRARGARVNRLFIDTKAPRGFARGKERTHVRVCTWSAIMRANHLDRKFRKIGRRSGANGNSIVFGETTDCCRENGAAFGSIKRQRIRTELYYNNNVRC